MALTVVTGPPAAGKTTYVQAHARPGDVVIDYDRIAAALTAGTDAGHRHPEAVQRVARRARHAAIHEALKAAADTDVWIIHTQPRRETLAEYARHGARVVTVDPGEDVVLARCAQHRTRGAEAAARRWYANQQHAQTVTAGGSRDW